MNSGSVSVSVEIILQQKSVLTVSACLLLSITRMEMKQQFYAFVSVEKNAKADQTLLSLWHHPSISFFYSSLCKNIDKIGYSV